MTSWPCPPALAAGLNQLTVDALPDYLQRLDDALERRGGLAWVPASPEDIYEVLTEALPVSHPGPAGNIDR